MQRITRDLFVGFNKDFVIYYSRKIRINEMNGEIAFYQGTGELFEKTT